MKIKFIAAFALVVWLAVTGWLATMVVVKPAVLQLGNDADETAAMVELRGAIAHNQKMQAQVERLRSSAPIGDGQPLLALPLATPPASGARVDAIGPDWVRIRNAAGELATLPVPSPYGNGTGERR